MPVNYRKEFEGLGIIARTSTAADTKGELEVISGTGKLQYHNGTTVSPVVTEAHTATLTNKTIDASLNTISNIANANISASAAIDASKIADGTVSNAEFQFINSVTSNVQTQLNNISGSAITSLTGDVTGTGPGATATTIANNVVSNAKLAQMAAHTFKGNNTGSTANALDLTATQLTAELNQFTSSLQGLVPSSGGGTTNFLRADGTWTTAGGSGANKAVNQTSHGFSVGNILYYTGSAYALAKSDADSTSEVLGFVSSVTDADNFVLSMVGYISGLSGLTAGTTYYLSDSSAGGVTSVSPTTPNHVSKPVLVADSTTSGYIIQSRGVIISSGSSSNLTQSTKTANYTVTNSDDIILCNGTFTITMQASSSAIVKPYKIKNIGTGTITLATSGSDLIDGSASQLLAQQYYSVELIPDGATSWNAF